MRFKMIEAKTMPEALAQLRATFGPDALILESRRTANGVVITGGIEPAVVPAQPWPHRNSLAFHGVSSQLAERLERHHLQFVHPMESFPLAEKPARRSTRGRRIQSQADPAATGFAEATLAHSLGKTFRFGTLNWETPLVLIGTPGAGKTLSLVKLAVQLVREGKKPLVINSDHYRAAALAQLAAFTRILDLELIDAPTPAALERALASRTTGQPVLIDLPGINPFNKTDVKSLRNMTDTTQGSLALVLQAGLDPTESADLAVRFAELGASSMIPTRLDIARRLGGILAAAASAPFILTNAGVGPGAADGMAQLTPDLLARYLTHSQAHQKAPESNAA